MRIFTILRSFAVFHGARSHIGLHADDGLDALLLAGTIKINDSIHYAMVGDSERGLPHCFCARNQIRNACRAVEQAILGMNV